MDVKAQLSKGRAKFVSLCDVITELSDSEGISISDSASAFINLLSEEQFSYIYRNQNSLLDYTNFGDINCTDEQICFHDLNRLAESDDFTYEYGVIYGECHKGWYKEELINLFRKCNLTLLECFQTSHISPASVNFSDTREIQQTTSNETTSLPIIEPYLDKTHPCYSHKLVATIVAWKHAVEHFGKSYETPRKHVEKWLVENKDHLGFDLTKQLKNSISQIVNFRDATGQITAKEKQTSLNKLEKYKSKQAMKNTLVQTQSPKDWDDIEF